MYHLHVKFINKQSTRSATGVLEYIARLGAYRTRGDTVRELITLGMPEWVQHPDGLDYWQCADSTSNRVNALIAFTVEFAIPRVLTPLQQRELVVLMTHAVSELCRGDHLNNGPMPMCAAIHEGHGRNPHVHLMVSTSIPDGIQRSAEGWFRRYNAKNPAAGGARRSRAMGTKRWLRSIRETWANVANDYLRAHGYPLRIDHRSNKTRGLQETPGIHLGPSAAYLKRNNRPAPRVERHAAREAERKTQERLDAEIDALNKARRELIAEKVRNDQSIALVEQQMMAELDEHINRHPFTASSGEILSTMTWMVTEQSAVTSGLAVDSSLPLLAQEAGDSWLVRHHKTGIYFARPGLDGLVMVARGFVVSDSDADEAVDLGLRLSKIMNFMKPMVAAKEALMDKCRTALEKLQQAWPLRQHTSKPAPVKAASRSNGLRR